MKNKIIILIPGFLLIFCMACVLNRFTRNETTSSTTPLPTYTENNPQNPEFTQTTEPPPVTSPAEIPTTQKTTTIQPSVSPNLSTATSIPSGIGVAFDCGSLIQIEVLSLPSFYNYLNNLQAKGKWLVLHLRLTNLKGETYNYLHENDFAVMSSDSGQAMNVISLQSADLEAFFVWAYSAYLVDPLPGGGSSTRIVAFEIDPAFKNWSLVFTPKNSKYSTEPFCTVEIPLS
jgi:hypothetical protein